MTTCLWFDGAAEDAARLYEGLFPATRIDDVARHGPGGHGAPGSVMMVRLTLLGQPFSFLNGGPMYALTPATSFLVPCETQAEIDRYWDALSPEGTAMRCGWLTDRFGVTWQIVPRLLLDMFSAGDGARTGRAMAAAVTMTRLDIAALARAADGEG